DGAGLRAELPGARYHQAPEDQLRRTLIGHAGQACPQVAHRFRRPSRRPFFYCGRDCRRRDLIQINEATPTPWYHFNLDPPSTANAMAGPHALSTAFEPSSIAVIGASDAPG